MTNKSNTDGGIDDPIVQLNIRVPNSFRELIYRYGKETNRNKNLAAIDLLQYALGEKGYDSN